MPTSATACATTPSCSARCPSRRCRAAGCWRATPRRAALLLQALRQIAQRGELSSAHLLFMDDADRQAAAERRLDAAPDGAVPLAQPPGRGLCRLRRVPGQPAARQAQEDRAGAAPRGRGRRARSRCTTARRSTPALWDFFHHCYTLTYAAHHSTPYLTRDFFARMQRDDGAALGDVRRAPRRPARGLLAAGHRPRRGAMPTAATGAAPSTCPACTSRPATTSR